VESPARTGLPTGAGVLTRLALDGGVVIGDDGSKTSHAALRWAAADATRRGSPLHVVRCWSLTTAPRPRTWEPGYMPPLAEWEAAVRADLALDAALIADADRPTASWHTVYAEPGPVLTAISHDVDLLVVGSRGHSALREMLLGSVASHLVHHATCPVVVVHAGRPRSPAPTEERSDDDARHVRP
jgi:nucleotide-binding universal stress UspA family protein